MHTSTNPPPLTLTTCAPRLRWRLPAEPDGRVYMTLAAMEGIATTYAGHPAVRAVAAALRPRPPALGPRGQIVNFQAEEQQPAVSRLTFARNLYHWLRVSVNFSPDPPQTETIRDPSDLLRQIAQHGSTSADCDDLATLAAAVTVAALGRAAAGFAVVSRSAGGTFQHVYPVVIGYDGHPIHIDPQEGTPFASHPKGTRRMHIHTFSR